MLLPMELERGIKVLQVDVCCGAIDQKFDCGCDCYAILHLHLLLVVTLLKSVLKILVTHSHTQDPGNEASDTCKLHPFFCNASRHSHLAVKDTNITGP